MDIQTWLDTATAQLKAAAVATARLDALVLLTDCLKRDKAQLLAHSDTQLTPEQLRVLSEHIVRRAAHEPIAYIRGKTEFYGRILDVNKNVLQPRPESEMIIDVLKKLVSADFSSQDQPDGALTIVDVGTGSGALAITAKLELPKATVIATDIDPACLVTAEHNARQLGASISCIRGDLVTPLLHNEMIGSSDLSTILLCNLPYVPDDMNLNRAARYEPPLAIFGGSDGLDAYRKLFDQLKRYYWKPRYILTESLPSQHEQLTKIASRCSYQLQTTDDFIQVFHSTDAIL